MAEVKAVVKEIRELTSNLILVGLCVEPNFPSQSTHVGETGAIEEISVSGLAEASEALRNRPYKETYNVLREKRAFNMRLIDGALVQFRYRFQGNDLKKHSLCFFPSPDLLEFQNDPEIYELDILYSEVIAKDVVTTPIRFDYDVSSFNDYLHPMSHFTLGQYKNCRIPVRGGLTPYRFMNFILRAFYNTPSKDFCKTWKSNLVDFDESATVREKADLHWSFGL